MQTHPDDLDRYVMDAVSDERREEIEAHVMACADCAAALQREARLELALVEVARAPIPIRGALRRRSWFFLAAGLAAAGLAAVLGTHLLSRQPAPPMPIVVTCPIDDHARACVDQARRHGLYVQFPVRRPVPIYEGPNLASGVIASN